MQNGRASEPRAMSNRRCWAVNTTSSSKSIWLVRAQRPAWVTLSITWYQSGRSAKRVQSGVQA